MTGTWGQGKRFCPYCFQMQQLLGKPAETDSRQIQMEGHKESRCCPTSHPPPPTIICELPPLFLSEDDLRLHSQKRNHTYQSFEKAHFYLQKEYHRFYTNILLQTIGIDITWGTSNFCGQIGKLLEDNRSRTQTLSLQKNEFIR